MNPTLITALIVFLAVTLATLSLAVGAEWLREQRAAKGVLKQLRTFAGELDAGTGAFMRERMEAAWVQALERRLPSLRDLSMLMERGRTEWGVGAFILYTLGLGMGFGLLGGMVSRSMLIGVLSAAFGALLPYLVVKRRASRRIDRFEEQLPDAIDLITRAIRAGHPLGAGLQMVAEEARDPIAGEFRRVFEEQRFGMPFDDALYGLADRVPLVDTRIMITAMLVQREVGGNLAEVLGNMAHVVRERFKIRRQLRVITAQGRLSGYVLAALPIFVGGVIFMLSQEYVMILFKHPIGKIMLVMALVAQVMGFLWIRKIVNIDI